jgi:hypothetical protein
MPPCRWGTALCNQHKWGWLCGLTMQYCQVGAEAGAPDSFGAPALAPGSCPSARARQRPSPAAAPRERTPSNSLCTPTPRHPAPHPPTQPHHTPQMFIFQRVLMAKPGVNVYDIRKDCVGPLCYDFSDADAYLNSAGGWQSGSGGSPGGAVRGAAVLRLQRRGRLSQQRGWVAVRERGAALWHKQGRWGTAAKGAPAHACRSPRRARPYAVPPSQACARRWASATASGRSATCWCTRSSGVRRARGRGGGGIEGGASG